MMSATSDSPRRSFASSSSPDLLLVRPSAVSESSILDSVAGFIDTNVSNVNANSNRSLKATATGHHEAVLWARFEANFVDVNDFTPNSSNQQDPAPPLVLVVGYVRGVQIWLLASNGEATLVSSWQQNAPIKSLRLLPRVLKDKQDSFKDARPIAAVVDNRLNEDGDDDHNEDSDDSPKDTKNFTIVSFVSLSTGCVLKHVRFSSEIVDVSANARVVIVTLRQKLALFSGHNLEPLFTVTSCYLSPGVHANPIALGDRFLAYADNQLVSIHRSQGGLESGHCTASMASWGINVGSKLAQGVSKFYTNLFNNPRPAPGLPASKTVSSSGNKSGVIVGSLDTSQKGVVTVLDVSHVICKEVNMSSRFTGVVAHFIAHTRAIVAMEFDPTGSLLLTCDRYGHYFNLFRLVAHPAGAACAAVHHLYALHRGDTPGSVQNISFSSDCRWVSVSTLRGTSHIFPITPYGGPITVRTHTSPTVVNKLSRFHRSAGIDENEPTPQRSSGRNSPNPNYATPPLTPNQNEHQTLASSSSSSYVGHPSPYMQPYPVPLIVQPLEQLRQPYIYTLVQNSPLMASTRRRSASTSSTSSIEDTSTETPVRLATCFAPSRNSSNTSRKSPFFRVDNSNTSKLQKHGLSQPQHQVASDSLFVLGNQGTLLEYSLESAPHSSLPKEKICESSPIEVRALPLGQWQLPPPIDRYELHPPLKGRNPLLSTYFNNEGGNDGLSDNENDDTTDDWLAHVEILTHVGPHRRLWMGPQFSFKTWRASCDQKDEEILQDQCDDNNLKSLEVEVSNLDLNSGPEMEDKGMSMTQPVNILNTAVASRQEKASVVIEACSASSLEYSPRFSSGSSGSGGRLWINDRGGAVESNVEIELHAAMAETVTTANDDSFFDGPRCSTSSIVVEKSGDDERFFSLNRDNFEGEEDHAQIRGSDEVQERGFYGLLCGENHRQRHESVCEQSVEDLGSMATFSNVIRDKECIESLVADAIHEAKPSPKTKKESSVNYLSDFSDNDSFPVLSPRSSSRSKRGTTSTVTQEKSANRCSKSEDEPTTSDDDVADVGVFLRKLSKTESESDEGIDQRPEIYPNGDNGDGWSFETDDIDVARLVDEVVKADNAEVSKVALDDIFKFESEMTSGSGICPSKESILSSLERRMVQSMDEGALVEASSDAETSGVMTGSLSCGVSDVDDDHDKAVVQETSKDDCGVNETKERKTSRKTGKKKRRR